MTKINFSSVEKLLTDMRFGRYVILLDDDDREGEADVFVASDFVTPDIINFMRTTVGGCMYVVIDHSTLRRLGIPLQYRSNCGENDSMKATLVDAMNNIKTGISSEDISHTISVLIDQDSTPADIKMPGHVTPIVAHQDGLIGRQGHTECGITLAQMAGLRHSVIGCELLNSNGSPASHAEINDFGEKHGIKIGKVCDVLSYFKERFRV